MPVAELESCVLSCFDVFLATSVLPVAELESCVLSCFDVVRERFSFILTAFPVSLQDSEGLRPLEGQQLAGAECEAGGPRK